MLPLFENTDSAYLMPLLIRNSLSASIPILLAIFAVVTVLVVAWNMGKKKLDVKNSLFAAKGFLITTVLLAILQILMKTSKAVQKAFFIVQVPVLTAILIALVCMLIVFITKTKLGQDIKTVGMNMQVATAAGINVDKTRIVATVLSTVIASWGQIIFLHW